MVRGGMRPPILVAGDAPRLRTALEAAFRLETGPLVALLGDPEPGRLSHSEELRPAERRGIRRPRVAARHSPGSGLRSPRPARIVTCTVWDVMFLPVFRSVTFVR